jgi:hypothetical protein
MSNDVFLLYDGNELIDIKFALPTDIIRYSFRGVYQTKEDAIRAWFAYIVDSFDNNSYNTGYMNIEYNHKDEFVKREKYYGINDVENHGWFIVKAQMSKRVSV